MTTFDNVRTSHLPTAADYVVVGAGAAGSVLAARLSEDGRHSVVLLEAGSAFGGPEFEVPGLAGLLQAADAPWYWGDLSVAQPALGGRQVPLLAARCLGGGSAVNTMMWVRGSAADYDGWAAAGAAGWAWSDVSPVFQRMEHFESGGDDHRGAGGPITVSTPRHLDPWATALTSAAVRCGVEAGHDLNGPAADKVGLVQSNTRDGARHSVLDGYLRAASGRPNLTVVTDATVELLLLTGTTVTGVRVSGGAAGDVQARRAVVVAAGALRSPQLLMRSGIGPAEHLREVGVEVVHDLPGVGQNLQDHPLAIALWPTSQEAGASPASAEARLQYELLRRGPLSAYFQVAAFKRFGRDEPGPDVQFNCGVLPGAAVSPDLVDPVLAVAPILLTPASRGQVRLTSSRGDAPAAIDPAYLTDDRDRDRLARALGWVRDELFAQPELAALCGPPLMPPPSADIDELGEIVRQQATSGWHFGGTCRMGLDAGAVVGPDLAVHGVQGLHVADASVMPTLPRGNPQAPTIMIAERAADLLLR